MSRFPIYALIAVGLCCLLPLCAEPESGTADQHQPLSAIQPASAADTTPQSALQTPSAAKQPAAGDSSGTKQSAVKQPAAAADTAGKKTADELEDADFASIQNTGLTVADGNKWYYEHFDRQGRQLFAVLYEGGTEIEKTVWTYQDSARYPLQKKTSRSDTVELILYDEKGRALTIEQYKGKDITSKTENTYNTSGKLIEQTVTAGKNTDKSAWDFTGDKAISQTKYRNGKKTAFIELHTEPHIIHLYVDDKEVFMGEAQ